MSPDAEDASPSPEPGTEHESGNMAVEKVERASTEEKSPSQATNGSSQPAKSNAKDPSRPRRKKARRACFACQRAHLTCGDERPCLRCIKRGLQEHCHDGVRKKAKYLHDAPAEVLAPGYSQHFHVNGSQNLPPTSTATNVGSTTVAGSQAPNYLVPSTPGHFPQYSSNNQPGSMGPPSMDGSNGLVHPDFPHPGVETPIRYPSVSSSQVSPVQEMNTSLDQTATLSGPGGNSFDAGYIDPNDPALFNFNVSDLNFGNHYGALEFGMLGHISSGAVNTPDLESMNLLGQSHHGSMSYDGSNNYPAGLAYNHGLPSWQNVPSARSRQNSNANIWSAQNTGLEAYAIGEQPPSLPGTSPRSQGDSFPTFTAPAAVSPETQFSHPEPAQPSDLLRQSLSHQAQQQVRKQPPFLGEMSIDPQRKRRRAHASEIYSSITAPYAYTQGFSMLIAYLQTRFSQATVVRIARALAKVRPSFITCNKDLDREDLIFMEKGLQRTLCEYEDFIGHCGTPTIICRRTGEIAAVSKEFSLVTGWRRDVLLGLEPNLNINSGGNTSGSQTGASTRGAATPRISTMESMPGRPQPVFLAELLDEDSVVRFYEDFAELAFGASRTSMIGLQCSIFKYRTKDDAGWGSDNQLADDTKRLKHANDIKLETLPQGDPGMNSLGDKDGRVECSMCWTVKRDMFDNPSLIVINMLPVI